MCANTPKPQLSVLVLTRNRLDVLRNCIQSILRQRRQDFELVILDDASDDVDSARAIAEEFRDPRIRPFHVTSSLGVAGGRNFLMERANGEILVVIDDDAVFVRDDALDEVCRALRRDPKIDLVAFKIVNVVNGRRTPLAPIARLASTRHLEADPQRAVVSFFRGGGHAIRKSVADRLGGYRHDMVWGFEETDLAFRVIQTRGRIIYEPTIEVDHFPMPSVLNGARGRSSSEAYYAGRNQAYLSYRYLPWKYAIPYLAAWFLRYAVRGIRQGGFFHFLWGVLAAPQYLRGTKREILDRDALRYIASHGGPFWKYLLLFERGHAVSDTGQALSQCASDPLNRSVWAADQPNHTAIL